MSVSIVGAPVRDVEFATCTPQSVGPGFPWGAFLGGMTLTGRLMAKQSMNYNEQ
jgi:hypothetical protein